MENNKKNEVTKVDTMAAQKKAQDEYQRYEYNDAKKFVRAGLAEIRDGQLINLTTGEIMGYVDEPKKVEKSKVVEKVLLLAAQKIMNKQGSMKVVGANEIVMEIFDVTGFSDILTIE